MNQLTQLIAELGMGIGLAAIVPALLGLVLIVAALKRLRHRKLFSAGFNGTLGLCLLFSAVILLLVAINIHTYQRLTYEEPILTISFQQLAEKQYTATLDYANGQKQHYSLTGDEWQIDARVINWSPPARILGLNALYRLERLHGRYRSIDQERQLERTVYPLSEERGLDIWSLAKKYQDRVSWIDTYFGSATYLPMEDGATYEVLITQNGLIARPVNTAAKTKLHQWK